MEEKEKPEPKQKKSKFIVTDAEQEEIGASYDIDGPFGIGQTKVPWEKNY